LDPLAVSHLCRSNPEATAKWPLVTRLLGEPYFAGN
jgi:hypothetical protein